MRQTKLSLILLLFGVTLTMPAFGQKMTIILVRHAEKDASANLNKFDPDLSDEGRVRAGRLFEVLKPYKPEHIFSTNLKRTCFTAEPTAVNLHNEYRMYVEAYNPAELAEFAGRLLTLKAKCVLVVGHSNTTPQLVNLLLKQEKYKDLPDTEYSKIFIIKINGKKVEEKVITY